MTRDDLNLCEGFIFNYEPKKPELSTVGILDLLRRSSQPQRAEYPLDDSAVQGQGHTLRW